MERRAVSGVVVFPLEGAPRPFKKPQRSVCSRRLYRVDTNGTITLRNRSRLRHIAVGRANKYQSVRLLIAGARSGSQVLVVREDGSLLREPRSTRGATTSPHSHPR
jgi:hypothetical protein